MTGQPASLVRRFWRPEVSSEALILAVSVLLAAFFNGAFWQAVIAGRAWTEPATWRFAIAVFGALVALQFIVLGLVAMRRTVRVLLAAMILIGAVGAHLMQHYGVVLDPSMLRNAMRTDAREAGEFFGPELLGAVAMGVLLALPLWWVRLKRRAWSRALLVRASAVVVALVTVGVAVISIFQDFSSLMRNQREIRYMITPANAVWSLARVIVGDARTSMAERDPPEPATRLIPAAQGKPTLLVLVVGETARAANFSLNGYARQTTLELQKLDVINFPRVTACGTSTEVSLPCMFSPFGRADYDAVRISRHESLLHLLARAGLRVVWLDNQSGCKGVCDGIETRDLSRENTPGVCAEDRCLDEILLHGLREVTEPADRDLVVVLHQLGNHGPAYFRRYPADLKRFEPACESAELRHCTHQEIVNAYDNAIVYTDHFLAQTIGYLDSLKSRFDVALVYVSDHGESLGEKGLFLHGMPYAIAPREQLEVPMLWWFGADAEHALRIDPACLRRRANEPASHDHLFHSVLGLLAVDTPRYRRERDLFSGCRPGWATQAGLQ